MKTANVNYKTSTRKKKKKWVMSMQCIHGYTVYEKRMYVCLYWLWSTDYVQMCEILWNKYSFIHYHWCNVQSRVVLNSHHISVCDMILKYSKTLCEKSPHICCMAFWYTKFILSLFILTLIIYGQRPINGICRQNQFRSHSGQLTHLLVK